MEEVNDMEYITLKALSEKIISDISPAILKVSKEAEKLAQEITEIEEKLHNSTDLKEIAKLSETTDEKRAEILHLVAIKGRLDGLVARNKSRIAYFDKILKSQGIYQTGYDKKLLESMEKQEIENISEKSLNLNKTLNTPVPKFMFGKLLYFKGKVLDFSLDKNKDIIISANEEFIRNILSAYPQSIATITAEELAHTSLKRKLLKELTYFIGAGLRDKTLVELNEQLGEPLSFKSGYTDNLAQYIDELENAYNVKVKRYLRERFPDHIEDIDSKLVCDESSKYLYEPVAETHEPEPETEEIIVEPEEPAPALPEQEEGFKEEKLASGAVRKSMVSKELTEAFVDPDAPEKEEEPEDDSLSDIDQEILDLYGIKIDDDEGEEE